MEITVKSKYLKISPRKLRLAVNLVRGKNIQYAKGILTLSNTKSSRMVKSLVDSAIASAKESGSEVDKFYINSINCSDGPRLKRGKPASKGSMMAIKKRQSHLSISISNIAPDNSSKKQIKKSADEPSVSDTSNSNSKIDNKEK